MGSLSPTAAQEVAPWMGLWVISYATALLAPDRRLTGRAFQVNCRVRHGEIHSLCIANTIPFSKGFWGIQGAVFSKKPLGASSAPSKSPLALLLPYRILRVPSASLSRFANKSPTHSGGYFIFGHSPNTTGGAQVRCRLACQPCKEYLLPVNGL